MAIPCMISSHSRNPATVLIGADFSSSSLFASPKKRRIPVTQRLSLTIRAETMASEKLGIKVERSPSESKLTELGVRQWPRLSFDELMDLSFILLSKSTTQERPPTIEATYGTDLAQKKRIKSFLRDKKENARNPDSIGSCSRRVILILPVVSSGLFRTYFALAKVKTNLFNENRLLEQNKKIQEANQAPKDFPNFIREGFQVKVVTSDKYVKSSSGLIYLDMQVGNGDCPKDGQQVTFHYTGYNESGRRIDSTYLRGSPAKIRLGNNALVPGFEEGIHDMRPGGKRRVIIPPELGPPVGPGTFFSSKQFEVFDVELLNIKDCQRRTIAFYSDVVCN